MCLPDAQCACCGGVVAPYPAASYRHQVFELPQPRLELTEYALHHGRCERCHQVSKGQLPTDAPQGQLGPRLLSYIAVLAGQFHLSVRKIQQLLKSQYGVHFSLGLISEAHGRVSAMLTPTHQALHLCIKQALHVHIDETPHQRNGESHTRWVWLLSGSDVVYQTIRYFRDQDSARALLGKNASAIVITDQCASYHWLDPERHQFCWSHIMRNVQQMADYVGQGHTAWVGSRLVLLCQAVFRTQHRYEAGKLDETRWRSRMMRVKARFHRYLVRGSQSPVSRYAGRCQYLLKYETGLWVFLLHPDTPLTNNEAERCLRGTVIMRKISYGTQSDRGEKFRSRILSVVETCKKRGLSAFQVVSDIVSAVLAKHPYPDVFSLTKESSIPLW